MSRRARLGSLRAATEHAFAVVSLSSALLSGCATFEPPEKAVTYELPHLYSVRDPQFLRSMSVLLGPTVTAGNHVRPLLNGDEIFPAMLDAINHATTTVSFETYIYWSGNIGQKFADALSERARTGVKVHVLLDWMGSQKTDHAYLDEMEEAGVRIQTYHPLRWYNVDRLNNRTHRKLLVIDGRIGFTGGVGIADEWTGQGQDPDHWRDTHFRIEGPAVAQLQTAFMDNWIKTTGRVLHGPHYYPKLEPKGDQHAQVFKSSSNDGSEGMRLMYLLTIAAAEKHIQLSAAYFVPDDLTIKTLVDALKRGVKVQIILPGQYIDSAVVRLASRTRWGELLKAGAEIYEYQPTMYHCKVMIIDGFFVSVGSTNFDNRSFRLNDEANLNVYDAQFALQQSNIFQKDLTESRRVTYEAWRKRPSTEQFLDRATAPFRFEL